VSVRALDRGMSDHTPLPLDTDDATFKGNIRQFRMELSWFSHDDFYALVTEIWRKPIRGNNSVQRWNKKMSALRSHLRGWAANNVGIYKQQKGNLISIINKLDVEAESHDLTARERNELSQAQDQLVRLLREEEIKYYQRAKVTDVLLGDNNTKYFQMVANGKHRKKRIFSLDHENGKIEGQANLKNYITGFYKGLFGEPEQSSFSLNPDRTKDISQVSQDENNLLIAPFTEDEIKSVVFKMEHNKVPCPDGFPVEFYQKFWGVIKEDLISIFHELHSRDLPLFILNFGIITLIPKAQDTTRIQQYRPICLLNVSFKIFTKVATIRLNLVADHVIQPTQTAFLRGRNILKGLSFFMRLSMKCIERSRMELF
jgi:hypothetical protein